MSSPRRRLAVVSEAAINEPHRAVYEQLARGYGWDVHIILPEAIPIGKDKKVYDPTQADARTVLCPVRVAAYRAGRFAVFRGIVPLLRRIKPAVVFAEYDPGSLIVLSAWAALLGSPGRLVAYSVENIYHPRFRQAMRNALRGDARSCFRDLAVGAVDFLGIRAAHSLACISRESHELFHGRRRWRKPIATIPLGTDLNLFQPQDVGALRAELGLAGSFVVGYFGRLVPEKGADLLIEALGQWPGSVKVLLDMFKNFQPGSYAESLLRLADRLGVRSRVVTIDVPHAEVPRFMNCCDTIVLPSRTTPRWKEQFGRVLPEAMACGVPVVGSDSGNIPDLVGEAGLIFPEGDVDSLCRAVLEIRDDKELASELRRRGHERVRTHFSVDVQAATMNEFFAAVARP